SSDVCSSDLLAAQIGTAAETELTPELGKASDLQQVDHLLDSCKLRFSATSDHHRCLVPERGPIATFRPNNFYQSSKPARSVIQSCHLMLLDHLVQHRRPDTLILGCSKYRQEIAEGDGLIA